MTDDPLIAAGIAHRSYQQWLTDAVTQYLDDERRVLAWWNSLPKPLPNKRDTRPPLTEGFRLLHAQADRRGAPQQELEYE